MDIIIEKEYYSPKMCNDNLQNLYIFGENQEQQHRNIKGGGQAVIRKCENSFGFCTKKSISEYWTDLEYNKNIDQIESDIKLLLKLSNIYTLVFPYMGLGTGLSKLPQKAPKTFLYLSRRLLEVFGFNNLEGIYEMD